MSLIIRPALREEIPTCAAIVAAALRDDPVVEVVVPRGPGDRLRQLTAFYTAGFLGGAFASGVVDTARREEDSPLLGVAAWIAPTDETHSRQPHRPEEPHWYLSDIAVVAAARRAGIGSALLAHRLGRIGGPAYLEATTPSSQRLYQRFGFEVVAALRLTPEGYPLAMLTR
ncbi:GNAT family N-acetyltransferase [Cryptosporangium arvum]|uniref:Acetyltransferase n=1 Tax=Cryptosporangium arvum DSM 44712 TaxID=927661 RepID=A0A010Z0L4_9ACTN|nr:GNAT family N-acetyltransferase [Cryptosporangium arvum]EXG80998.1 acetyltransferase [Cryptosporangium arvum DSM 44712]